MVGKITKKSTRKQWRSPEGIQRRNEAERARVKATNAAFEELRAFVPNGEVKGKKKSKLETLQAAIDHINHLAAILHEPTYALPTLPVQNKTLPQMVPPAQAEIETAQMIPSFEIYPDLSNNYSEYLESPVNYSMSSDESLNFSSSFSGYSSPSKDLYHDSISHTYNQHYSPY